MEHEDKEYENHNNVLTELVKKYNIRERLRLLVRSTPPSP